MYDVTAARVLTVWSGIASLHLAVGCVSLVFAQDFTFFKVRLLL